MMYKDYQEIVYPSIVTETDRKANILLPGNYQKDRSYPVLYLLHGIGGDENEWKQAEPEKVIGELVEQGLAQEMIVVLPNVRARKEDGGNPVDIFTLEHFKAFDRFREDLTGSLMPYMAEHFSIRCGRENTALAGLSMGGREALYIGLTRQEYFGYVGAFSPAFGLLAYTNNAVTEQGLLLEQQFCVEEAYRDNTLIMISNGNQDRVVFHEPRRYHEMLERNGVKHTYSTMDGGHDFGVWTEGLRRFVEKIF